MSSKLILVIDDDLKLVLQRMAGKDHRSLASLVRHELQRIGDAWLEEESEKMAGAFVKESNDGS